MTAIKLHLDTDIGGDMDDLCALAMLLNWPNLHLLAVTTNCEAASAQAGKRAGYARYTLDLAGRSGTAVASGADVSLGCYRVYPGLPDEARYWPATIPPYLTPLEQALDLLEESIAQGALILGIGAYTNLALLERRSPGILQRANLYLMGGYIFPTRPGFPAWGNEMDWNLQEDVASAHFVLQHSDPTLIPLSVTVETALRRAHLPALRQSGALGALIARQAEAFAEDQQNEAKLAPLCPRLPPDLINFQHDPLACAIALGWNEGVQIEEIPLKLEIVDGWLYERIDPAGRPTRVVTRVDGEKFSEFWVRTITHPTEFTRV